MADKYKLVVSYTTRPIRENEIEGREHYFITDKEADKLLKENKVIAYTKIGETGYRYFTLENNLVNSNCYIIDPTGIKDLKKRFLELRKRIKIIYIYTPSIIRELRAKNNRSDYNTSYKKRCEQEDKQFSEFERNKNYDKVILNVGSFESSVESLVNYMDSVYKKDTLFLIVGRTCSGKDSLTNNAIKILNKSENTK